MNPGTPATIEAYLEQLKTALAGADPALIQDALYDAEEYLRSELAEHPELSEAALVAQVASSYGAPDEVADIYRGKEQTVQQALRAPPPPKRTSLAGRFFGVAADPRAYAALFYMLLSLATGIFYFTWTVTGISLSMGLLVLIVGLPFAVLFLGTVRALALVEGRLVEVMLGVRMPRRPLYVQRDMSWLARIGAMFTDPRTWSTLLYLLLMLPLGVVYFTVVLTGLVVSFGLIAAPFAQLFGGMPMAMIDGVAYVWPTLMLPLLALVGVLLLFGMLHLARGIGHVHGQIARHLLVKTAWN